MMNETSTWERYDQYVESIDYQEEPPWLYFPPLDPCLEEGAGVTTLDGIVGTVHRRGKWLFGNIYRICIPNMSDTDGPDYYFGDFEEQSLELIKSRA